MKKPLVFIFLLTAGISISMFYQNCAKLNFSAAERSTLQSVAFTNDTVSEPGPVDVQELVSGVDNSADSIPISSYQETDTGATMFHQVGDCSEPGRYEKEKEMALAEAKKDPTGRTIPVKYSFSFGDKHDILAKYANERAILSSTNPGHTYVPVGPKNSGKYDGGYFYYTANHDTAKKEYMKGERCFFNTIQINDPEGHFIADKPGYDGYDFFDISNEDLKHAHIARAVLDRAKKNGGKAYLRRYLRHMLTYMYYGYCSEASCGNSDGRYAGEYANRLFKEIPATDRGEPQIIKLYVADFRTRQLNIEGLLQTQQSTVRGQEKTSKISELIDICLLSEKYDQVIQSLGVEKTINGYDFGSVEGVVQVVQNIMYTDTTDTGVTISTQYTPIVLDLGKRGVSTSSVRWGTYFNMAALENPSASEESIERFNVPHRTAWVGGQYRMHTEKKDITTCTQLSLRAQDGFLVFPDQDGKARSSRNMFGDNLEVDGKTYENGFLALQALSKKDCESLEIKDRYFGPWDKELYHDILKVWIDSNRNGVSEESEILSLKEAGVVAINSCHTLHVEEHDIFGNGTALRSAYLKQNKDEDITLDEEEIVYRLEHGKSSKGLEVEFRLAIDLIFKVEEQRLCSAD